MRHDGGRPTLCLITDRRRLVAARGVPLTSWESELFDQIRGAIDGGVDAVQIREGDLDATTLTRFVRRCLDVAGDGTRIIVNDRLDVTLATVAHGVHLRADGPPASALRPLMRGSMVIGRSIHSASEASAAGPVDYLIAGSVFETASKPGAPPALGLDGLHATVARAVCPVWAIGGITAERLPLIREAGAGGAAAIGAFIPAPSGDVLTGAVQELTRRLRFCFDSSRRLS